MRFSLKPIRRTCPLQEGEHALEGPITPSTDSCFRHGRAISNDFWRFLKRPGARWKCVEFGFLAGQTCPLPLFMNFKASKTSPCWKNVSYMSRWYEPSPCELRSGYGARAGYNEQMEIGTWQIITVALADADTHHWGSLSGWRFQNSNVFIFTHTYNIIHIYIYICKI